MDFDPYKILKVDPSADEEVVSAAYRALSKKYHPDLNKSPEAQTQMQAVNKAYNLLRDPASRAKVDAELDKKNKQQADSSANYRNTTIRPNPDPPYSPRYGTSNWKSSASDISKKAQERIRVAQPGPDTFYLYQKRLVDEGQNKLMRIAVYHDKLFGKVCNINATAPDAAGRVSSGSVFLHSLEMFDLTDAVNEALAVIEKPSSPIETTADHAVFYRKKISGLNSSYLVVEVIKPHKSDSKQVLFLIGERRGEGVISSQTEKQLRQIERILTEAFTAMR